MPNGLMDFHQAVLFMQRALAAPAAAATTTVAVADHWQLFHGAHLLSQIEVCLYVGVKKIPYVRVLSMTCVAFSSGANFTIIWPQQKATWFWFSE